MTAQVHKKVFGVICNESAVSQLTQRVRKAIKKKHCLLIDVKWIKQCQEQNCRIDHKNYLLTELAEKTIENKSKSAEVKPRSEIICHECNDDDVLLLQTDIGWSEPVSLDCCCVCHETNRDDCKWCEDCNVTLALKTAK